MRRLLTTLLPCALAVSAQGKSFLVDPHIAVFYPEPYQVEAHSPSPIFLHELVPTGELPTDWRLRPVFSTTEEHSVATIAIGPDDDLYGTGEVTGPLRRNDCEIDLWNRDNYGYLANEGRNLYQTHPWVLGLRPDGSAYGIIADNTWKARLTTSGSVCFESWGPPFRVVIIEGRDTREVIQQLARLTGHMEMPPLWALGYQQCRWSYYPDTRVKEVVDSLRINRIPCDVIWMDIDYMDEFRVFTFDKEKFPDPEGLQQYVHDRQMMTVYMIDPGVKKEPGYWVWDEGKRYDFYVKNAQGEDFTGPVWPGDCNFPDFTRSEVRTWWSGLTRDFMRRGADGLWNDMNEPAVFEREDGTMDEDAIHLVGEGNYTTQPHLRVHNIYGMEMIRASREGALLAHPDRRPFVLSRDNFLGGQRFGATWNGDNMSSWEHLLQSIPMTLNLGLSGQPFNGPDLGGFGADCDAELLAHWVAMGIYFPFARNHAAKGTANQEPWAFGPKVLDIYRTAVNRRYRLMPYLYTLFQEASVNGMPVMRPLFMADEKDLSLRQEQQAYLLGQDLLILPRWAKTAALPKGNWSLIPFESPDGRKKVDDGYQAFVALRPGAIVPLAELAQSTEAIQLDSLTLLVNLDEMGHASGSLYEDAGEGFGYRTGDYVLSVLSAVSDGKQVTVSVTPTSGNRPTALRRIRLGLVADGRITYSPWTTGTTVTMKAPKIKPTCLDPTKLKWSGIDPTTQLTVAQKLEQQKKQMEADGQKFEF